MESILLSFSVWMWHRPVTLTIGVCFFQSILIFKEAETKKKALALPCVRIWECSCPCPWCISGVPLCSFPTFFSLYGRLPLTSSFETQSEIFVALDVYETLGQKVKAACYAQCWQISFKGLGVSSLLDKQRFALSGAFALFDLSQASSCPLWAVAHWQLLCSGLALWWLLCGDRQVVEKAAVVKKAIVWSTLSLPGAMATNSVGELTMSLCAGSTDYAPGMTNIFFRFPLQRLKSAKTLKCWCTIQQELSLNRQIKVKNKAFKDTLIDSNKILSFVRSYLLTSIQVSTIDNEFVLFSNVKPS